MLVVEQVLGAQAKLYTSQYLHIYTLLCRAWAEQVRENLLESLLHGPRLWNKPLQNKRTRPRITYEYESRNKGRGEKNYLKEQVARGNASTGLEAQMYSSPRRENEELWGQLSLGDNSYCRNEAALLLHACLCSPCLKGRKLLPWGCSRYPAPGPSYYLSSDTTELRTNLRKQ